MENNQWGVAGEFYLAGVAGEFIWLELLENLSGLSCSRIYLAKVAGEFIWLKLLENKGTEGFLHCSFKSGAFHL